MPSLWDTLLDGDAEVSKKDPIWTFMEHTVLYIF